MHMSNSGPSCVIPAYSTYLQQEECATATHTRTSIQISLKKKISYYHLEILESDT